MPAGLCCEPIGYVRRLEPVADAVPRGREAVMEYGEYLMSKAAMVELAEKYCDGLRGIRRGMVVWIIWLAHQAPAGDKAPLVVHPFMDERLPLTGVFATRSPARPCPLGMSLVYVEEVEDCGLRVRGLDALDGTPVLDIKPYARGLDSLEAVLRRARGG
jgi:tRNA-Thr(GGU) m(6)t(6)A37 methyltransferase TsaA